MKRRFTAGALLAGLALAIGCTNSAVEQRSEVSEAERDLQQTRQEAEQDVAEARRDANKMMLDARDEAVNEVQEAERAAAEKVDEARQEVSEARQEVENRLDPNAPRQTPAPVVTDNAQTPDPAIAQQDPGNRVYRTKDFIGAEVQNADGEELGEITDLVFDPRTGQTRYAVLSFGGFLGIGDKLFAIPFKQLQTRSTGENEHVFVLDIPKEQLEKAPGFNKDAWPAFEDSYWSEDVDAFYGARG